MTAPPDAGAQPNRSLIDGFTCLQSVVGSRRPVGCRELARSLDLDPTRVNRLLKTLAHVGLVEQDAQRKYRAGPGIHALAAQSLFASRLLQSALPVLRPLQQSASLVALGVLWRDQVSYLYHWNADVGEDEAIARAALFPAADSVIGLAVRAHDADTRAVRRPGAGIVERSLAPDCISLGAALPAFPSAGISLQFDPGRNSAEIMRRALINAAARIRLTES